MRSYREQEIPPAFLGVRRLARTVWCSVAANPQRRNSNKQVYGTGTEVPSGSFGLVTVVTVLSEGTGEVPIDKKWCIVRWLNPHLVVKTEQSW